MWLRKKINRTVFWLAQKRFRNNKSKMSEALVMLIDPALFQHTVVTKECVVKIDVILPNLMAYLVMLSELDAAASRQDEMIKLDQYRFAPQTVTLERFFTNATGQRVDVVATIEAFKDQALRCVRRYQALEHEQTGIPGYNKRFMNQAVNSIVQLTKQLRDYSLT